MAHILLSTSLLRVVRDVWQVIWVLVSTWHLSKLEAFLVQVQTTLIFISGIELLSGIVMDGRSREMLKNLIRSLNSRIEEQGFSKWLRMS